MIISNQKSRRRFRYGRIAIAVFRIILQQIELIEAAVPKILSVHVTDRKHQGGPIHAERKRIAGALRDGIIDRKCVFPDPSDLHG